MKVKLLLLLLSLGFFSIAARGDNRNKATHPASQAKITPCAPGVVYLKMKVGSEVWKTSSSKGEIVQSIAPSSAFARVIGKLVLSQVVPFDPAPVKDSISRAFGIDRMYCLYYSNRTIDPHAALAMLETTGEVECGSVRYLFPMSLTTNDPDLGQQYALTKMNVFGAWNSTFGDTSIVIADVDCAINIDHEDLKNEIKYNEGWDLCGDVADGAVFMPNNNPRPREDGASHGTHTAGCMVATGNNGVGIAGVAFGCRLLPIKASGSDFENISAGYEGIHYASTHGARIINCSWGGLEADNDTAYSNVFLVEAHARGALIVASAGNGINNATNGVSDDVYPEYPANGPFVLSVGATDQNDQAAPYSDYGHSVGVWAPGTRILSCDYTGAGSNSAYSAEDGTSFASPNTAGVAALILSQYPTLPPEFLARQIIQTADNVVNPSDRADYWGRVDADSAVSIAPWPGLIITQYSINSVVSAPLGAVGVKQDLNVTFKNVVADGTGITATIVPSLGYMVDTTPVVLGAMTLDATASGDFHITRSGVYSEGIIPVRFFVTDGKRLADTLILSIPLTTIPGFVPDIPGTKGSSITRVSNSVAWAAFGQTATAAANLSAQFAAEAGGSWSDTSTLNDGTNPPYTVEAIDSNNAFFGTGSNPSASVIFTNDGGQTFNPVVVSSFTPFVNTIHFFDSLNGILIGDPISNKWGIGITTDGGQSWNPLGKTISASGTTVASWNNSAAWVGDNGWFGTNSNHIWRTTNRGQTWTSVHTTYQHSLGVAFNNDAKHGMACFQPVAASTGGTTGTNGIMVSADSGASWDTLATLPAPGISPEGVRFIPNSSTAIITSDMGIYRTPDLGLTWTPIGIPVSFLPTGSPIGISRGQGEFVVSINSANSSGIATYTEAMPDTILAGVAELPASMLSFEVYPNPTESSSVVSFVLPVYDHVRIVLYDALGRKVVTLCDGAFGAGPHQASLDAGGLQSGVYYVDFEAGSGAHETRAITILP